MKNVWVVSGKTESNDDIGPFVFAAEPTESQLRELAEWYHEDDCPNSANTGECECGPGEFGSYSHFQINKVEVQ